MVSVEYFKLSGREPVGKSVLFATDFYFDGKFAVSVYEHKAFAFLSREHG